MMAMMTMERRCIRTGQPPNSKVARTPTLPIPPMRCTPQCIPVHHSVPECITVQIAPTWSSTRHWPAVHRQCWSGVKSNPLNFNGERTLSQLHLSALFLGTVWAQHTCNKEREDSVTLIVDWQYWQPWIIALTGNADRWLATGNPPSHLGCTPTSSTP